MEIGVGYPKWIKDAAAEIDEGFDDRVRDRHITADAATIHRHYLASLGDDRIADAFAIFEEIRIKRGAEVVIEAVHGDPPHTHPSAKWLVWFNLADGGSSRDLVGVAMIKKTKTISGGARNAINQAGSHVGITQELLNSLEQPANDPINHPRHYTAHPSGIECIQITEHMNFNLGNALKYIWRADLKGDAIEDLKKALWYIQREIDKREKAK